MTDPETKPPYRVEPEAERFKVVDAEGRVLMVTGTAANAEQYVVLLNQAFARGYKAGFRDGKRSG